MNTNAEKSIFADEGSGGVMAAPKSRRKIADDALIYICGYLKEAGWTTDLYTFFQVDPLTKAQYPSDTAFSIQLGRDLFPITR